MKSRGGIAFAGVLAVALLMTFAPLSDAQVANDKAQPFQVMETSIEAIHAAFKSGRLTARQLTQAYLDRIAAYDPPPTIGRRARSRRDAGDDDERRDEYGKGRQRDDSVPRRA